MTKVVVEKNREEEKGFTLIELLVVIGIIAILAAIVIVAINPSRQFAQARNTQRESNVATILNAIGQNIADNRGTFNTDGPDGIAGNADDCETILTATTTIGTVGTTTDLGCLAPTYIPTDIPADPSADPDTSYENTLYTVRVDTEGRYTVCAPQHKESAIPDSDPYCLTR